MLKNSVVKGNHERNRSADITEPRFIVGEDTKQSTNLKLNMSTSIPNWTQQLNTSLILARHILILVEN